MFFPVTSSVFVLGDSVFMLFKCMCNDISIEKKYNMHWPDLYPRNILQ